MTKQAVFCAALVMDARVAALATEVDFPEPRAEVLLLGTFHFADAGLDEFEPEFDVDVMSPERQAEIAEILDALAGYAPTRIAVEVRPERQGDLDASFQAFLAGEKQLTSDEVHQLAFRLGRRLSHERLWAVDAERRFYEPWVDPDEYAAAHGQTEVLEDPWPARYEALYRYEDRAKTERPLADTLLAINSEASLLRHHGRYLVESFKAGVGDEYPGVDAKIAWYNRNLRIFANLQRITERDDERILLIIGAGHVPILRHCVEASPEYRLVEVAEVLRPEQE